MSIVLRHGRHRWVPDNRWDLVAPEIHSPSSIDAPPSVAVIVPYFEQPTSLERMYAALALSALDPCYHELIVVDDGSVTPPPRPAPDFPLPTRLLHQPDLGCRPGTARNRAAAASSADVLVFLDADTVPSPDCVARLAAWPATLPDAVVVGRRHHVDLRGWSSAATVEWLRGYRPSPPTRPDPAWLDDGYRRTHNLLCADDGSFRYVISAVMACHRSLFEDIGAFDEHRVDYGGEDWEFASRAFNNGAVLVHDPDAVAWHDEPNWTDRGGRLEDKNAETMWLASMIPEPSTRGNGLLHRYADVIVVVDPVARWTDGSLVAMLESVLIGLGDVAVHLPHPVSAHVRALVEDDGRVRLRPPSRDELLRARTVVSLRTSSDWDPDGFARAIAFVRSGRHGTVSVEDAQGPIAHIEASRTVGRARRAHKLGLPGDDVALLSRSQTVEALDVGLRRSDDDVDLAALFGGWQSRAGAAEG